MTSESRNLERLIADAIEDARDETLDESRLNEIRALLASSREARLAYLKHNRFTRLLSSDAPAPTITDAAIAAAADAYQAKPGIARPRGVRPVIAYTGWMAAAAVLAFLLINSLRLPPPKGVANVQQPDGSPAPGLPVAMITNLIDPQWQEGESRSIGDDVDQQWLRLTTGVVQLEFGSGAQLALQGPAELRIDSDMECFLQTGKLTVLAPPEASRFTVKSPSGNVIDLGTEFGVVVDADGQMDVHVLDGEVEVETNADETRTLVENQAATIDPASKLIAHTPIDRETFDPIRHATLVANKALKLQFDCGIRAGVYQGTQSPGHAAGDMLPGEVYWNGLIGDQAGRFVLADGSVSPFPLEIDYGQTASAVDPEQKPRRPFRWDAEPQLVRSAHCVTRGVFDTALGRDRLSAGGTVGLRIRGLPVGTYRIYFIARSVDDSRRGNYLVLKAFRVAMGSNIDTIAKDAPVIEPLDDPDAGRWIAGQTHHEGEVELVAEDDLLTLLVRRDPSLSPQTGGGGTSIVGVQIVQLK